MPDEDFRRELARRRDLVRDAIGDGVLVVPAAPTTLRNNDVEHEYRQSSDFFYLTGFEEPQSVLVLRGGKPEGYTLFVRRRDPEREIWDGRRAGVEGATAVHGANVAFTVDDFDQKLPELLENVTRLYYCLGVNRDFDERMLRVLDRVRARGRSGVDWPTEIVDPRTVLHEARLFKNEQELSRMRKAARITAAAHTAAMRAAKPGMYEHEIEALLLGAFRREGSQRVAYPSIVGSGPNATILHYRENDRLMQDGDLLLIDAGCEYGYYASDVTRTFPVNGKFTPAQRAIYQIVLDSQLAAIEASRPGRTLEDVHDVASRVIAQGLIELGFIAGPVDAAIEEKRLKPFYMHRTSHWLGMDVHDVGRYHKGGKPRLLEPGMVITVEPGIYIAADDATVPPEFRGIGVRIEDDVAITSGAPEVMTEACPKTIADIEATCAG